MLYTKIFYLSSQTSNRLSGLWIHPKHHKSILVFEYFGMPLIIFDMQVGWSCIFLLIISCRVLKSFISINKTSIYVHSMDRAGEGEHGVLRSIQAWQGGASHRDGDDAEDPAHAPRNCCQRSRRRGLSPHLLTLSTTALQWHYYQAISSHSARLREENKQQASPLSGK